MHIFRLTTKLLALVPWATFGASFVIPEHEVLLGLQLEAPGTQSQQRLSKAPYDGDIEFENWAENQQSKAFEFLLANIGSAVGAAPGAVIASPSRTHPDYFYQWIRDAGITIRSVVREFDRTGNENVLNIIEDYVVMQAKLQHTVNPSGGYRTGGLGEPKFEADGTAFWGNWGRSQNDGPALRSSTIIDYLRALNKTVPSMLLESPDWMKFLYDSSFPTVSVIKADLEYVSHAWQSTGFDVWEEVNGFHFFTAMTQLKAMIDGQEIALFFNDTGAAAWYALQQQKLNVFVHQFWDSSKGHLVATLDSNRDGLDCAVHLGSLYGGSDDVFPPWSDEILISVHKLLQDMRRRHRVNEESYQGATLTGWGVGRYPSDIYNGDGTSQGNPWFLCTSSVSEILYRTIIRFTQQGEFEINELNIAFFQNVYPNVIPRKIRNSEEEFGKVLELLFTWADGFLKVVKKHAKDEYRLSEQFDTDQPGFQKGARDLTWSYGSIIEALKARTEAREYLQKLYR